MSAPQPAAADHLLYMGWRIPRIMTTNTMNLLMNLSRVKERWPEIPLQFEDFAQKIAMPLLNRYRNEICSFNDDIRAPRR
ncbi:hypothetical protein ACNKHM_27435 [Shigella sonnei]